jgi:2-oxoglutarate dehydrogenase complex dehydrogenase (E1) component-like enzyme
VEKDLRKALEMRREESAFYKDFQTDLKSWSKEIDEKFDKLVEQDKRMAEFQGELREQARQAQQRQQQAQQRQQQAQQRQQQADLLMIRYRSYEQKIKDLSSSDPDYKTKSELLAIELDSIKSELTRLENESKGSSKT